MTTLSTPRILAAFVLGMAAAAAQAIPVVNSGNLVHDIDVVKIDFTLVTASTVSIWTDSWSTGLNFDPTVSLFDAASKALIVTGDDTSDPALLHAGQGGYDSEIDIGSLAAGQYFVTLGASGNDPVGTSFTDGFTLAGTTPIAIADWNQPSYDINKNDQKGSFWRVNIDGATAVAAVPEPSGWASMALGLAAIGVLWRRRSPAR